MWAGANSGYWPLLWFFGKLFIFIFFFIWLRGSLPRMRYDQFMALGWKVLIPVALGWTIAVATIRLAFSEGAVDRTWAMAGFGVLAVLFLGLLFLGDGDDDHEAQRKQADEEARTQEHDAFAGGYPVPPMPGAAVRGAAAPLTFATSRTTVTARAEEDAR